MKVLDLFSGTGGWSDPWLATGHDVKRVELDPVLAEQTGAIQHDVNDTAGLLERLDGWTPDVILASPPCDSFTVMRIGRNWHHDGTPKNDAGVQGMRNVVSTLRLIMLLRPEYWVIENPRAKLRSLPIMDGLDRLTVWYCRLGETRAKPTDLWYRLPLRTEQELLDPKYTCANGNPDHTAAPRGSTTGTQGGVSREEAYRIPTALATLVRDGIAGPDPYCYECEQLDRGRWDDSLHMTPDECGCTYSRDEHHDPVIRRA